MSAKPETIQADAIEATGDNVFLRLDEAPKQSAGGIIYADDTRAKLQHRWAVILAVGPCCNRDPAAGTVFDVGDHVAVNWVEGTNVTIPGDRAEYKAIEEKQVKLRVRP